MYKKRRDGYMMYEWSGNKGKCQFIVPFELDMGPFEDPFSKFHWRWSNPLSMTNSYWHRQVNGYGTVEGRIWCLTHVEYKARRIPQWVSETIFNVSSFLRKKKKPSRREELVKKLTRYQRRIEGIIRLGYTIPKRNERKIETRRENIIMEKKKTW